MISRLQLVGTVASIFTMFGFIHRQLRLRNHLILTNNMPGDSEVSVVGILMHFIEFSFIDLRGFFRRRFVTYGPIFRTNFLACDAIVIADKGLCNEILSDSKLFAQIAPAPGLDQMFAGFLHSKNGDEHKAIRAPLVRTLSENILHRNISMIGKNFADSLKRWTELPHVDFYAEIRHMMCETFLHLAFGASCSLEDEREFEQYFMDFGTGVSKPFLSSLQIGLKGKQRISQKILDIIEQRKLHKIPIDIENPDLLSCFCKEDVSDQIVADNVSAIVWASIDTTMSLFSDLIVWLSKEDAIREKMITECISVWGPSNSFNEVLAGLNNDEIQSCLRQLVYMDCVIKEVLRLTPPGAGVFRCALEDFPLRGTNYVVPKGWSVYIPLSGFIDEKSFPDCRDFKPERFLPGGVSEKEGNFLGAMKPFGGGIHICPGRHMVQAESKLFLSMLVVSCKQVIRYFLSQPA
jgi:cytochrome P450